MILATKAWLFGKLIAYAPLTTLLGGAGHIFDIFPNSFQTLPVVFYDESTQNNNEFYDDQPLANDTHVDIHIATAFAVSDGNKVTDIAQVVDALMVSLLFTLSSTFPIDDPTLKTRHRILRYHRDSVMSTDLV